MWILAKGALLILSIGALVRGLTLVIGNPMTGGMLGAVAVSLVAGRAGVTWAEGNREVHLRALRAAGLGAAVAAMGAAAAMVGGGALRTVDPTMSFVFGLFESAALAYRDEVWLHGIPLVFAARARVPERWAFGFATVAGAAPSLLLTGSTPAGLVLAVTASAFFSSLWLKTRDGWAPVAAHFGWAWLSEALLSGELLDVVSPGSPLGRGAGASGTFAWVAAAAFAALAAHSLRRRAASRSM